MYAIVRIHFQGRRFHTAPLAHHAMCDFFNNNICVSRLEFLVFENKFLVGGLMLLFEHCNLPDRTHMD